MSVMEFSPICAGRAKLLRRDDAKNVWYWKRPPEAGLLHRNKQFHLAQVNIRREDLLSDCR